MTVQELYDWAKERDLLDKTIAKHFNFTIENIRVATYLDEELTCTEDLVVVD